MFKAEITKKYVEIEGTGSECLIGLIFYIDALRESKIPDFLIKETIKIAFEDKKDKKEETTTNKNNMKVQKFDLNNMTTEEATKKILEEVFKMFD